MALHGEMRGKFVVNPDETAALFKEMKAKEEGVRAEPLSAELQAVRKQLKSPETLALIRRKVELRLGRGQKAAADDVVQEIWLRADQAIERGSFKEGGNFNAWLNRLILNYLNDEHHRRLKHSGSDAPIDSLPHPAREQDQWMNQEDVRRLIELLPDNFREVFRLRHIDGLDYQIIADTLDIPVGTVMSRLNRSKKILQEFVDDEKRATGELAA